MGRSTPSPPRDQEAKSGHPAGTVLEVQPLTADKELLLNKLGAPGITNDPRMLEDTWPAHRIPLKCMTCC